MQGKFSGGLKQGDFNYFDEDGTLLLTIKYKDGHEKRLNDVKLPPPFEPESLVD